MHAPILIVDENDNPTGSASMDEAQRKGLYHRIVRVFVFNSNGELFLQKRSKNMANFPGLWDQSVGGHVDAGEDNLTAAIRETKEEIGLENIDLTEIGTYKVERTVGDRHFNRFNVLYSTVSDDPLKLDPEEVDDGKWVTLDELDGLVAKYPADFTEGLVDALAFYRKKQMK